MSLIPLAGSSLAAQKTGLPASELVVFKAFFTKNRFRGYLIAAPDSFTDFICE